MYKRQVPESDMLSFPITVNNTANPPSSISLSFSNSLRPSRDFYDIEFRFYRSGSILTNVSTSDFEVINESGTVQTGWTIANPGTSLREGSTLISLTAPNNTFGSFALRLKANSLTSTLGSVPSTAITSEFESIDKRISINRVLNQSRQVVNRDGKLQYTLNSSVAVTGIKPTHHTNL